MDDVIRIYWETDKLALLMIGHDSGPLDAAAMTARRHAGVIAVEMVHESASPTTTGNPIYGPNGHPHTGPHRYEVRTQAHPSLLVDDLAAQIKADCGCTVLVNP